MNVGFFGNGSGLDGAQAEALRIPNADGTLYPLEVGEDDALMPSLLTLSREGIAPRSTTWPWVRWLDPEQSIRSQHCPCMREAHMLSRLRLRKPAGPVDRAGSTDFDPWAKMKLAWFKPAVVSEDGR